MLIVWHMVHDLVLHRDITAAGLGMWHCSRRLKNEIILPFYKNKGARSECKNYRGITLLSIPGKAHTVFSRAKQHLQTIRRREQSGFTPRRSTIGRIATLKLILQRRHDVEKLCWVAYVDFRSSFDSVNTPALWLLLKSRGIPQKLIDLMKDLYTNTVSCVQADGVQSDWFPFSAGV